ncbi:hypothetical protein [Martelella sp. AMO21009]
MYIIYFFAFLVTTQETIFALLGLSGGTLFLARAAVDLSSVVLFVLAATAATLRSRTISLSGIRYERPFMLFFCYSIVISLISTQASLLTNGSEIFVLNRFVFLAMALPYVVNSDQKVQRLLRFLFVLIIFQATIGILQLLGGPSVIDLFKPNDYSNILTGDARSFTSNRSLSRRMLIGSMGDFISFGYMMLFGMIFAIARLKRGPGTVALLLMFLALVFFSGSRTIFLAALVLLTLYLFSRARVAWRVMMVLIILLIAPIVLNIFSQMAASTTFEYTSFLGIFNPKFIDALLNQRLGHVVLYLPKLLGDPMALIGFSPDRRLVEQYVLENYGQQLPYIYLATFYHTLEDFYPIALLSYYGLIGTALFYLAQYRIFAGAKAGRKSDNPLLAQPARIVFWGIIGINILSFGNQSFENRGLSFMFWLSVGLYASAIKCTNLKHKLKT